MDWKKVTTHAELEAATKAGAGVILGYIASLARCEEAVKELRDLVENYDAYVDHESLLLEILASVDKEGGK